ncbi:MAG: hypothetical protein PWP45_1323 [Tepidanaerobacteraceae bacterium]|nr:hypothetical protein [Tepidanaerobacteraceae bacterium]
MNRGRDWLKQALRDYEKARDKATAKEALDAAGEIIRFCENIVRGL